jgi:hypothetical protein
VASTEYTPTTDEIREATVPGSYQSWGKGYFDRWLAAHDREVAAKAWDEAYDYFGDMLAMPHPSNNPYR